MLTWAEEAVAVHDLSQCVLPGWWLQVVRVLLLSCCLLTCGIVLELLQDLRQALVHHSTPIILAMCLMSRICAYICICLIVRRAAWRDDVLLLGVPREATAKVCSCLLDGRCVHNLLYDLPHAWLVGSVCLQVDSGVVG